MDHGAFADGLQALPMEWQEDLRQKRLASVPVLANVTDEELIEEFALRHVQPWSLG